MQKLKFNQNSEGFGGVLVDMRDMGDIYIICKNLSVSNSKYGHQQTNSTFVSNITLVGSKKLFLNFFSILFEIFSKYLY